MYVAGGGSRPPLILGCFERHACYVDTQRSIERFLWHKMDLPIVLQMFGLLHLLFESKARDSFEHEIRSIQAVFHQTYCQLSDVLDLLYHFTANTMAMVMMTDQPFSATDPSPPNTLAS